MGPSVRLKLLVFAEISSLFWATSRSNISTCGTFVARFIAKDCPVVGKSMNDEALKLIVFEIPFHSPVFSPPLLKSAQVFRS